MIDGYFSRFYRFDSLYTAQHISWHRFRNNETKPTSNQPPPVSISHNQTFARERSRNIGTMIRNPLLQSCYKRINNLCGTHDRFGATDRWIIVEHSIYLCTRSHLRFSLQLFACQSGQVRAIPFWQKFESNGGVSRERFVEFTESVVTDVELMFD